LPPFIEGGYQVKSEYTGVAVDDHIFTTQRYIMGVKKQLSTSVVMFTEDSKGPGGNYQAWRQTFSNAVGELRYINDFVMGGILRSRIAQDVARSVINALGKDDHGAPLYWKASAIVIDAYLQKKHLCCQDI
jgi:hypothetical protein